MKYILDEMSRRIVLLMFRLLFCSRKKNNRYSSVPESWVRWRSSVMNVSARSCLGCRRTSEATCPVRITRNSKNNAWPLWSSRGTWGSTSNSALGRGGNCGRRSSLSSTSLASRTRWPWVSLWDIVSSRIYSYFYYYLCLMGEKSFFYLLLLLLFIMGKLHSWLYYLFCQINGDGVE